VSRTLSLMFCRYEDAHMKLQDVIAGISYKADWHIRAVAPRVWTEEPAVAIEHDSPRGKHAVTVINMPHEFITVTSECNLARWLFLRIEAIERHDCAEWFTFNGKHVVNGERHTRFARGVSHG
jgi:hypothetical protein